jgi:hypothetical protein
MQLKPFDLKCLLFILFLGDQLNKQEHKKGGGLFCFALNQKSSSYDTKTYSVAKEKQIDLYKYGCKINNLTLQLYHMKNFSGSMQNKIVHPLFCAYCFK